VLKPEGEVKSELKKKKLKSWENQQRNLAGTVNNGNYRAS